MMSEQKVIWSDYAFDGKLIKVRVDTVELTNGEKRQREIVEHNGAVGIVPVLDDGRIVLVRQHRPAVGRSILEIPAGTVEAEEEVEATAVRELTEETGYVAGSIRELVRFFVSPGWANEELVIYVADDLSAGEQSPEDDEDIAVEIVAPADIPGLIQRGEIADSKTIVGLSTYLGIQLQAR